MMTEENIFEQTKGTYLCLIHPKVEDPTFQKEIESLKKLAPAVSDELVAALIIGSSWRERLLGLYIAMTKKKAEFGDQMIEALQNPRGISLVPTCAA